MTEFDDIITLELTIHVTYRRNETPKQELVGRLFALANQAAGDGMLTGSDAEVENWGSRVHQVVTPPQDTWSEDTDFPRQNWREEVYAGNTQLGYWGWVAAQMEAAKHEG